MRLRRAALVMLALALPASAAAQAPVANIVDERVRASAGAAEGYQGPLDGAWTLTDAAGVPIYDFQLVERAGGGEALQGVFRDLRAAAVGGDIGFIDSLARTRSALALTFHGRDGPPVIVNLHSAGDGAWSGELREAGAVMPVRLVREPDF